MWSRGRLVSKVRDGKEQAGAKFSDYFDFAEPLTKLPSHRILALFRGEKEEVLDLELDPERRRRPDGPRPYEARDRRPVRHRRPGPPGRPVADRHRALGLAHPDPGPTSASTCGCGCGSAPRRRRCGSSPTTCATCCSPRRPAPAPRWAWTRVSAPASRSPSSTPPARSSPPTRSTRTSRSDKWDESLATLAALCQEHGVELVAIGNGTASRETDKLAADLVTAVPGLKLTKVMVSEAGASVYSASAFAAQELPELDVSIRGAVSIARRLQDPLAELVKIDPKSIGVGQYQHDSPESSCRGRSTRSSRTA